MISNLDFDDVLVIAMGGMFEVSASYWDPDTEV